MSDRKYRQRGYQDDGAGHRATGHRARNRRPEFARPEREPGAPAGARRISSEGARNPRMMGSREVARCARCGTIVDAQILSLSKCTKCQHDLRSCVQCVHFDPSARFECTQTDPGAGLAQGRGQRLPALHRPHIVGARNHRGRRRSNPQEPSGAKKAFDDLFKF